VDREQGTLTTVGHAAVVIDHLFICVAIDAPESAALTRIGLIEGTPNTHPGQGTACRRFFFRNMYLELIWVHDRDEARSHAASKLELWERWSGRHSGASPFGVVVRPAHGDSSGVPPFRTWTYRPTYLPPRVGFDIASGVASTEPMFVWTGAGRRPHLDAEPTAHRIGSTVTGVRIISPVAEDRRCEAAQVLAASGTVAFDTGDAYLLELTLDEGRAGKVAHLRKTLPLRLRW
jgi:hypothetical protein